MGRVGYIYFLSYLGTEEKNQLLIIKKKTTEEKRACACGFVTLGLGHRHNTCTSCRTVAQGGMEGGVDILQRTFLHW